MDLNKVKLFVKAKAPVNIAIIKYWGKRDEKLKIPINDSISGTLSMDDLCTTTSVYISDEFTNDKLILNGQEQELAHGISPAKVMIEDIRMLSEHYDLKDSKVHIVSENNFPTAAGLASSAAGYACLAYALGHAYGVNDASLLSRIARKGSGSACRSLFGGFVHWARGTDHESSLAYPVVDSSHWPSMRVVICVVDDDKKKVSSSSGMARSVETSPLIKYRADYVVPERVEAMKRAIVQRDFQSFSNLTMQDSNQFHAICLDTFPPIIYLNETSRKVISICSIINEFYGYNRVAYTFDAGPNACIYLLEEYVSEFIELVKTFFPSHPLEVKGRECNLRLVEDSKFYQLKQLISSKVDVTLHGLKYIIITSIGDGPKLIEFKRN